MTNRKDCAGWLHGAVNGLWLRSFTGKGVRVAVVDSGISAKASPTLREQIEHACIVHGYSGEDIPRVKLVARDHADDCQTEGHGTGVASIILSVAPAVRLYSVQCFLKETSPDERAWGALGGLAWALKKRVNIINMSMVICPRTKSGHNRVKAELYRLCEKAYQRNVVIVAARANIPSPQIGLPAEFSNVISVDSNLPDDWDSTKIRYNFKSAVELSAHGERVSVLTPDGYNDTRTGTSYATPHVTGLCALLLEAFPQLSTFQVKAILAELGREK